MDRRLEVEEARVGDRLPPPRSAVEDDPGSTEVGPRLGLFPPDLVPALADGEGDEAGGLVGRMGMDEGRDERGHLAHAIAAVTLRPEGERRRGHPGLITTE